MVEEKKEEKFNISFTKEELLAELQDLENDKDIENYLSVQKGIRKLQKHESLVAALKSRS
jgi:hypothetical protein